MTQDIVTMKNKKKEEKKEEEEKGKEKKGNWLNNYWYIHITQTLTCDDIVL